MLKHIKKALGLDVLSRRIEEIYHLHKNLKFGLSLQPEAKVVPIKQKKKRYSNEVVAQVKWLWEFGLTHEAICELMDMHPNTALNYIRGYNRANVTPAAYPTKEIMDKINEMSRYNKIFRKDAP